MVDERVVVVGAGPAGLALAAALRRAAGPTSGRSMSWCAIG
jgi:2-polyprenyl-6-methoxyphenol hydroxylase-like FAD-dependent oxidoreductase